MTLLQQHPVVLHLVTRHLRLADAFRLRRALGAQADTLWLDDVPYQFARDMGLSGRAWHHSMPSLGARMARTKHRCVECGVRCRRVPPVCESCASDPTSSVAMCTRVEARAWHRTLPRRVARFEERLVRLPVAKRGPRPGRRRYHWRRDVATLLLHATQTTTK